MVIGLSGGVDSAVSLALGVIAIGADNIYPGIFPYGELNKEGTEDAKIVIEQLKIPPSNIILIDIKPFVDRIIDGIYSSSDPPAGGESRSSRQARTINSKELRRGNIMARMRMILLYDMSKKYNALVLGTENKTEHLLGYFTRFGDEASDLEPIINLYKTQVRQLAGYLKIPEKIINKIPTAGMWMGQTDESEFGFSYENADKVLNLWNEKKYSKENIIKTGISPELVDKVVKRAEVNAFKHILPYTPS